MSNHCACTDAGTCLELDDAEAEWGTRDDPAADSLTPFPLWGGPEATPGVRR